MKTLYIMCGPAGVGKSTWIHRNMHPDTGAHVSRDDIRFEKVREDEYYFAREDEVCAEYCNRINWYLHNSLYKEVYADATQITEASRNKLLSKLNLEGVRVVPIVFNAPLETALRQNKKRDGRRRVPASAIHNMYRAFRHPKFDKFEYADIKEVGKDFYT